MTYFWYDTNLWYFDDQTYNKSIFLKNNIINVEYTTKRVIHLVKSVYCLYF